MLICDVPARGLRSLHAFDFEHAVDLPRTLWAADQEALRTVAAETGDELELLRRLDSLRHGDETERAPDREDAADEAVVTVCREAGDEALIDLKTREGELLEI